MSSCNQSQLGNRINQGISIANHKHSLSYTNNPILSMNQPAISSNQSIQQIQQSNQSSQSMQQITTTPIPTNRTQQSSNHQASTNPNQLQVVEEEQENRTLLKREYYANLEFKSKSISNIQQIAIQSQPNYISHNHHHNNDDNNNNMNKNTNLQRMRSITPDHRSCKEGSGVNGKSTPQTVNSDKEGIFKQKHSASKHSINQPYFMIKEEPVSPIEQYFPKQQMTNSTNNNFYKPNKIKIFSEDQKVIKQKDNLLENNMNSDDNNMNYKSKGQNQSCTQLNDIRSSNNYITKDANTANNNNINQNKINLIQQQDYTLSPSNQKKMLSPTSNQSQISYMVFPSPQQCSQNQFQKSSMNPQKEQQLDSFGIMQKKYSIHDIAQQTIVPIINQKCQHLTLNKSHSFIYPDTTSTTQSFHANNINNIKGNSSCRNSSNFTSTLTGTILKFNENKAKLNSIQLNNSNQSQNNMLGINQVNTQLNQNNHAINTDNLIMKNDSAETNHYFNNQPINNHQPNNDHLSMNFINVFNHINKTPPLNNNYTNNSTNNIINNNKNNEIQQQQGLSSQIGLMFGQQNQIINNRHHHHHHLHYQASKSVTSAPQLIKQGISMLSTNILSSQQQSTSIVQQQQQLNIRSTESNQNNKQSPIDQKYSPINLQRRESHLLQQALLQITPPQITSFIGQQQSQQQQQAYLQTQGVFLKQQQQINNSEQKLKTLQSEQDVRMLTFQMSDCSAFFNKEVFNIESFNQLDKNSLRQSESDKGDLSSQLNLYHHLNSSFQPIKTEESLFNNFRTEQTDSFMHKQNRKYSIADFEILKQLGQGVFGSVYMVRDKKTKGIYALKMIDKSMIKEKDMEAQLQRELKIHQEYSNHVNILECLDNFQDERNYYILMEYASDGTFANLLESQVWKRMNEIQSIPLLTQLLQAIHYLHSNQVIHRDLKLENVLLSNGNVKICDFGCATFSENPAYQRRRSFCGTVDYVSPEMIQDQVYDKEIDVWAFGVIVFEINAGFAPFTQFDEQQTYSCIINAKANYPKHFSEKLKDFLNKIFVSDVTKRSTARQLLKHEWIVQYNKQNLKHQ